MSLKDKMAALVPQGDEATKTLVVSRAFARQFDILHHERGAIDDYELVRRLFNMGYRGRALHDRGGV